MRTGDLRSAGDVVPQDIRHTAQEIAQQCFAAFFLVGRPCRCGRPDAGDRLDQHDQGGDLAATSASSSDEETGPLIEQRAFDQRQRGSNDRALASVIGGDVAQPFIGEEPHRPFDAIIGNRCALGHDGGDLGLDAEVDTALPVEPVFASEHMAVGHHHRQRGDGDQRRQGVVVANHVMVHEVALQVH